MSWKLDEPPILESERTVFREQELGHDGMRHDLRMFGILADERNARKRMPTDTKFGSLC